jgi:hypothetical protein
MALRTCSRHAEHSETVRHGLTAFIAQTGADELMVSSPIFDHAARLRSYALVAEAMGHAVPAPG